MGTATSTPVALVFFGAASLLVSGCIPVAMFPSEHRVGTGVVGGRMRGEGSETTHGQVGPHFTYRATIAPLAMVPALWDRDFDFGLGYLVMASEVGSLQHGPTVDLSYFLLRADVDARLPCESFDPDDPEAEGCRPEGEHQLFRIALRVEADLRFTNAERDSVGAGGRVGLRLDFSWLAAQPAPVAGVSSSSSGSHPSAGGFVGATWGEYGIALDVLGGGGFVGEQAYGELVVALTLRAPAIAGIAIVVP